MNTESTITNINPDVQLEQFGPPKPPNCIVMSDEHGADVEYGQILRQRLGMEDDQPLVAEAIAEACARQGVDKIYNLGDLLDRGPNPPETFRLTKELVKSGNGEITIGNHDLMMMMHHLGVHLNFASLPSKYETNLDNGKVFRTHEYLDEPEVAYASTTQWAPHLAEFINYAKQRQKEVWKPVLKETAQKFSEYYGTELDFKKADDILNFPDRHAADNEAIKEDLELNKWWGAMLGHNVGSIVYTGLNDVESMSLNWWEDKKQELLSLMEKYPDDSLLSDMVPQLNDIIKQYKANLTEKLDEGNWQYLMLDAMMSGNYKTKEWNAFDWLRHKGWGGLEGGLLEIRNKELEAEGKPLLDYSNYPSDPVIKEFGEFFHENFCIYKIDAYGNLLMHSMPPLNNHGEVHFGRVDEKGDVVPCEEGEGMDYAGRHYSGPEIFEAFDQIAEIVRDFDPKQQSLSEIDEELSLIMSWWADNTTNVKPVQIARNLKSAGKSAIVNVLDGEFEAYEESEPELISIGMRHVANKLGVNMIVCGHNPAPSMAKAGIERVVVDNDGLVAHVNVDGGMAKKYGSAGVALAYGAAGNMGAEIVGFSGEGTPIQLIDEIPYEQFFSDESVDYWINHAA